MDDLTKLLQSIREQDVMRSDLPSMEPEFVTFIMNEYMKRMIPHLLPQFRLSSRNEIQRQLASTMARVQHEFQCILD